MMQTQSKILVNGVRINFNQLLSEQQTRKAVEKINLQLTSQQKELKEKVNLFLTSVLTHLEDRLSIPKSKFYTVLMFRDFTEQGKTKILSFLTGHPLFGYLTNLARIIDPMEPVQKKGRKLFDKDPQSGNEFIRIILECIKFWGQKFLKTKKTMTPTKFKTAYNSLQEERIVIPQQYKYFKILPIDKSQGEDPPNKNQSRAQQIKTQQGVRYDNQQKYKEQQKNKQKEQQKNVPKYLNQLRFGIDKINTYITKLEDASNAQQSQKQITQNRNKLLQDYQKIKKNQTNIFDDNNSQAVAKYLQITDFMNQQQKMYKSNIPKKDYRSYILAIKIESEKTFKEEKPPTKVQKVEDKKPALKVFNELNLPPKQPEKQPIKLVQSILGEFQSRSKSPGFKAVKESIYQEKKNIMTHPPRPARKSPSPINRSQTNLNKSQSYLKQSKISHIFANPPNKNISSKNYQGKLVIQDSYLAQITDLQKQQGIKRFKLSQFKDKNPLFENQHIQIGYKSEAIYEDLHNFKNFIGIELFIGNKTQNQIRNLKVQYKGDSNQLLYAHPRQLQSIIPSGFQNKHQLMIAPINFPFSLLRMKMQYEYKGQQFNNVIILPNSIIKLARYQQIKKNEFTTKWRNGTIIKSQSFALSQYLAPQWFSKWIPEIKSFQPYSDFEVSGNTNDHELYCSISLAQTHKGLLKINIRPNLQVIIQIAMVQNSPQSCQYFEFYLQTLALILQHQN